MTRTPSVRRREMRHHNFRNAWPIANTKRNNGDILPACAAGCTTTRNQKSVAHPPPSRRLRGSPPPPHVGEESNEHAPHFPPRFTGEVSTEAAEQRRRTE